MQMAEHQDGVSANTRFVCNTNALFISYIKHLWYVCYYHMVATCHNVTTNAEIGRQLFQRFKKKDKETSMQIS